MVNLPYTERLVRRGEEFHKACYAGAQERAPLEHPRTPHRWPRLAQGVARRRAAWTGTAGLDPVALRPPQALRGQASPLDQRLELGPHDARVLTLVQRPLRKPTVGPRDHPLPPHHLREGHEPLHPWRSPPLPHLAARVQPQGGRAVPRSAWRGAVLLGWRRKRAGEFPSRSASASPVSARILLRLLLKAG